MTATIRDLFKLSEDINATDNELDYRFHRIRSTLDHVQSDLDAFCGALDDYRKARKAYLDLYRELVDDSVRIQPEA